MLRREGNCRATVHLPEFLSVSDGMANAQLSRAVFQASARRFCSAVPFGAAMSDQAIGSRRGIGAWTAYAFESVRVALRTRKTQKTPSSSILSSSGAPNGDAANTARASSGDIALVNTRG